MSVYKDSKDFNLFPATATPSLSNNNFNVPSSTPNLKPGRYKVKTSYMYLCGSYLYMLIN